ncbi:ParB/RepB/Spo0J family partition protein [Duganella qianjiadongensis]|uniref:ParB N-terminal domain-containing protein n=1 Tax=Duganella qianjiadongensis TaxID=2692176 RepID=A0ABW9VJC7_9BURK|nr:ParB/RepB/Spo0J family partition protein [Duganella qianjiadongensis]MYM38649.1 ParB N-terminal domain-containing protein [Duganella qianjiadongensis]
MEKRNIGHGSEEGMDAHYGGPIGMHHALLSRPQQVLFGSLQVAPERFQVRNPDACSYVDSVLAKKASIELSRDLVDVLKSGGELDPLLVFDDDGALFVFEGHHRYEAMLEAGFLPNAKVWIQKFKSPDEAQARALALEVNRRAHLAMNKREVLQAYWLALLSGEVTGSVRQRVKRYRISHSTVTRMDKEARVVREELQRMAMTSGVPFTPEYCRGHAPLWKSIAEWREQRHSQERSVDVERLAVEKILRSLTLKYAADIKAQPEAFLTAVEELFFEVTGEPLRLSRDAQAETFSEF